jgi:hypothetical protein
MRGRLLLVVTLGWLAGACGNTQDDREATGALSGAAMGAIVGGPIGAVIGAGAGYVAGNKLDKSADEKMEDLANTPMGPAPQPTAAATTTPTTTARKPPAPTPAPSGAADSGPVLTEAQIRDRLHAAGYKPVHAIRRDGQAYVARGERGGTLYDVRVEAASGTLLASREVGIVRGDGPDGMLTEQQIRTALRQGGYEMVGDVARAGDRYRAEAMQNGRMFDVLVDGRTGKVVAATPAAASASPSPQGG